jgi:flagellar motor switch/type III secretory pathway protein FliN
MSAAASSLSPAREDQPKTAHLEKEELRWRRLFGLSCELTVEIPIPHFRVVDFAKLGPSSLVSTEWQRSREVPLRVNGKLIGWGEFEGSREHLAVRLTELA